MTTKLLLALVGGGGGLLALVYVVYRLFRDRRMRAVRYTLYMCPGLKGFEYAGHVWLVYAVGDIYERLIDTCTTERADEYVRDGVAVRAPHPTLCAECTAQHEHDIALFTSPPSDDVQPTWRIHLGTHQGTLASRDDACMLYNFESYDACAVRIAALVEYYHRTGFKIWYATIVDPDGEVHSLEEYSERYTS